MSSFHQGPRWREIRRRYRWSRRESYYCDQCGIEGEITRLEVDHIIPLYKGGAAGSGNLQLLCAGCHSTKSARERERAPMDAERLKWIDDVGF